MELEDQEVDSEPCLPSFPWLYFLLSLPPTLSSQGPRARKPSGPDGQKQGVVGMLAGQVALVIRRRWVDVTQWEQGGSAGGSVSRSLPCHMEWYKCLMSGVQMPDEWGSPCEHGDRHLENN